MDLMTFLRSQWDRAGAWVAVAVGALLLVLGWLGVSDTPYVAEQIPYVVSGGLGGIFLLGLGAVLWLSADLRDEWRLLEEIRKAQEGAADAAPATEAIVEPATVARPPRQRAAGSATR